MKEKSTSYHIFTLLDKLWKNFCKTILIGINYEQYLEMFVFLTIW